MTDRDKMREEIANVMAIIDEDTDKPIVKERVVRHALADKILSLLAPVIEKAEKWEQVEECPRCNGRGELTYMRDGLADLATCECAECNGSGKIRAEWAREEG